MKQSAKILALLGVSGYTNAESGLLNSTDNQKLLEDMMKKQQAGDHELLQTQDGPPVPGIPSGPV